MKILVEGNYIIQEHIIQRYKWAWLLRLPYVGRLLEPHLRRLEKHYDIRFSDAGGMSLGFTLQEKDLPWVAKDD